MASTCEGSTALMRRPAGRAARTPGRAQLSFARLACTRRRGALQAPAGGRPAAMVDYRRRPVFERRLALPSIPIASLFHSLSLASARSTSFPAGPYSCTHRAYDRSSSACATGSPMAFTGVRSSAEEEPAGPPGRAGRRLQHTRHHVPHLVAADPRSTTSAQEINDRSSVTCLISPRSSSSAACNTTGPAGRRP